MIAIVVFLPAVLMILNELLVIALCCFTIWIGLLRAPSALVLSSSVLEFFLLIELLLFKIEKAFAIPLKPKGHWILLTTINRYTDLFCRLAFFVGAFWLLVILIRHKKSDASQV